MLIETILPQGGITGLTANPGVGKTWLALEMARAVATGGLFLGKFPAREGSVVLVGQDASVYDYGRQMRKLLKEEYDAYETFRANEPAAFNPLQSHIHPIIQPGIRLERKEDVERLITTVDSIEHEDLGNDRWMEFDPQTGEEVVHVVEQHTTGADLIILDTLSSMKDAPENDNTEMERCFRNLRALSDQTGAGVLVIHHNSHATKEFGDERWRGASSQWGALDNWYHLRPSGGDKIKVIPKKMRGLKPDVFSYTMDIDESTAKLTFVEPDPEVIPIKEEIKAAVLAYLSTDNLTAALPRKAIGEALRPRFSIVSDTTYWKYIDSATSALSKSGKLRKVGNGWVYYKEVH
jgi:hypothetical protein